MSDLVDIVTPLPPSWLPGTVGWLMLAITVAVVTLWAGWRAWRHWRANRYRREALAEWARLQADLQGEGAARARALLALAELLKRCALAAWPRTQVASITGVAWRDFVHAHAGKAADAIAPLQDLIEVEYRDAAVLAQWPAQRANDAALACRRWITAHRTPDS